MNRRLLRKIKNGTFLVLSLIATMIGPGVPGGHSVDPAVARTRGHVLALVHANDAAAGQPAADCSMRCTAAP